MASEPDWRRRIRARLIIAALAAVLVVILIVQNAQTVSLNILVWEIESRLIWALALVGLLGFLVGLLLPRLRR